MFQDECGDFGTTRGNRQCIVEHRMGDSAVPLLA